MRPRRFRAESVSKLSSVDGLRSPGCGVKPEAWSKIHTQAFPLCRFVVGPFTFKISLDMPRWTLIHYPLLFNRRQCQIWYQSYDQLDCHPRKHKSFPIEVQCKREMCWFGSRSNQTSFTIPLTFVSTLRYIKNSLFHFPYTLVVDWIKVTARQKSPWAGWEVTASSDMSAIRTVSLQDWETGCLKFLDSWDCNLKFKRTS